MSEKQDPYITDAMEMMGMQEPRQIVTEISGFVPVFDVLLTQYDDHMTPLVFGRIWQYCGMSDGVCRATIDRIANDLKISGATVMRHIEKLEADGYIYDRTPERRNRPHEYVDCGQVVMKGSLSAIAQKNVRVAQKNVAIAESQLIKQDNTNNKDVSLNSEYLAEVNKKVDYIIAGGEESRKREEIGTAWRGRELLPPHYLPYGDWWSKKTGLHMYGAKAKAKVDTEWLSAMKTLYENDVTIASLESAYDSRKAWTTVSKLSQIVSDAKAIQAAGEGKPAPQEIKITDGIPETY